MPALISSIVVCRGGRSVRWQFLLHSIAGLTAQHVPAFWQPEQETGEGCNRRGCAASKSTIMSTQQRPPSHPRASGELTLGVLWDLDDQHVALGPVHDLRWDGAELVTLCGS